MNPYPYGNNQNPAAPPNQGAYANSQQPAPPLGFGLGFGGPPNPSVQPYPNSQSYPPPPPATSHPPLQAPQQTYPYSQQQPYQQPYQPYPAANPNQASYAPMQAPSYLAGGYQQQQPVTTTQKTSHDDLYRNLVQKYEIGHDYANRMQQLAGFKIVFIFDDSSSMNSQLGDSPLLAKQSRVTRWNELEYFASIALELANCFDQSGCDVYFLNKQPPVN